MSRLALFGSLVLGIGALTWSFYDGGYVMISQALGGFGLLWAASQWRHWAWFSALGLVVSVIAGAGGLWLGLPMGWMIVGTLGGLLTWDLSEFTRRLRFAAPSDELNTLERAHLARLTIIATLGVLIGTAAMLIQFQLTFEWAVLLVLVTALGITQLVAWLRRGGE